MFRKEKKNKQTSDQITLLSYGYIHMYVGLIKKKKKNTIVRHEMMVDKKLLFRTHDPPALGRIPLK